MAPPPADAGTPSPEAPEAPEDATGDAAEGLEGAGGEAEREAQGEGLESGTPGAEDGEDEGRLLPELLVEDRAGRDLFDSPALESPGLDTALSSVDQSFIRRQNAFTVVESMRFVPGAWIESRGRKVKQFVSIRGQRYPYPEFAVDGAWQREFHEMPYLLSASHIGRLDVMRSGGALLLGPGATVGYIDLVPRTFDARRTSILGTYGMFNTTNLQAVHGDAPSEDFSYAVGFGHRSTDGPSGKNAAENLVDVYGRVSGKPIETLTLTLDVFGLYGKRELEQAEAPASSRFQQDLSRYDPYRALLTVGKARLEQTETASLELTTSFGLRDHDFVLASESDPSGTLIAERDWEVTLSAMESLGLFSGNTVRFGGLYNHWVAPNGKRFYVGRRSDLETYSAVVVDEQELGPVTLNAGYRWSRTRVNEYGAFGINGSGNGFQNVAAVVGQWDSPMHNGSLGASYQVIEPLSLHANLALGHVAPRAGTLTDDLTAPDRETRYLADLGARLEDRELGQITVTGFYVFQEDAIALSGNTADNGGLVVELYTNRDQEQLGIEADGRTARFGPGFELFTNVVAMSARRKDGVSWIRDDEVPEVILSSGVLFTRWRFDGALFVRYLSGYRSQRFVPGPQGRQDLGDFITLDANAGYTFGETHRYRIFVAAQNLTDERFSTVNGYPDYGIQVSAGLHVTLY